MQGRISKARDAIAALEGQLGPHISSAFTQRWLLYKADALMVSGLRTEALRVANEAVAGYDLRLETSAFAGAFARWMAITCTGTTAEPNAREVLKDFEDHLEEYDAMDQLEILCASAHMNRPHAHAYQGRIAEKLKHLPPCTAIQLRALGIATNE
jgi:hypothetical protein